MNRVVISLGSNIQPRQNIQKAIEFIENELSILSRSRIVETQPIGRTEQPNYLNGALLVETTLKRDELKTWLLQIEQKLGRVRSEDKYTARTIDLDIVVWNGKVADSDVYERDFLRAAVLEVLPNLNLD